MQRYGEYYKKQINVIFLRFFHTEYLQILNICHTFVASKENNLQFKQYGNYNNKQN